MAICLALVPRIPRQKVQPGKCDEGARRQKGTWSMHRVTCSPVLLGEGLGGAGLESLAAFAFFARSEAVRSPFESQSVQPGFPSQPGG